MPVRRAIQLRTETCLVCNTCACFTGTQGDDVAGHNELHLPSTSMDKTKQSEVQWDHHLCLTAGMEGEGGDEVQGHNELRLRHALDPRTRRWARAEFFCSALDRPWLASNGVQQLCNHFGLRKGQLARLSRTEWTCIRRSLGRPRRLSLAFLRQVGTKNHQQWNTLNN